MSCYVFENDMIQPKDIFEAIERGYVDWIIMHPEQYRLRHHGQKTTLQEAIYWGHEGIVLILLSSGMNVNYRNRGRTPLYEAFNFGDFTMLETILENGADPNKFACNKHPINWITDKLELHWKSSVNPFSILQYNNLNVKLSLFFKYGADPNLMINSNKYTKEFIVKAFFRFVKSKWLPVGLALPHISAGEQMCILEHLIPPSEIIPIEKRWKMITMIKHF